MQKQCSSSVIKLGNTVEILYLCTLNIVYAGFKVNFTIIRKLFNR